MENSDSMPIGINTSANNNTAEVTNISPFGIWLLVNQREFFLSYTEFPFFENASIKSLANVNTDCMGNLHWSELDVDIEYDSLDNLDRYPLVYKNI